MAALRSATQRSQPGVEAAAIPPRDGLGAMLLRARAEMPIDSLEVLREWVKGVSLAGIGRRRGVTREWIHQIKVRATREVVMLILASDDLKDDWGELAGSLAVSESRLIET